MLQGSASVCHHICTIVETKQRGAMLLKFAKVSLFKSQIFRRLLVFGMKFLEKHSILNVSRFLQGPRLWNHSVKVMVTNMKKFTSFWLIL